MFSVLSSSSSSSLRIMVPQWRHSHKSLLYYILPHSNRKLSSFIPSHISSSSSSKDENSASSAQSHLGYDPSEELFGLYVDLKPRNVVSAASQPRSWFGPNGQYIRELPCPSCRGRGYTPCAECGIERSRPDCSLCIGKGVVTCHQCCGDCVIWEESIDERPWEKARSISPLKVKEDDEVDNLEIKLEAKRKTKRVNRSSDPEVNLKISRSLKSLNARTGIFSNRMKIIHGDPMLRAQRVAAIKISKGTAAARKHASETMKSYFQDPENRRKRSIAMKGIKFYCRNCGQEGHRRNYCPETKDKFTDQGFRCRLCGEKGHNRRTCPRSKPNDEKSMIHRTHHCKICGQIGHNRRTCPQLDEAESTNAATHHCKICGQTGHNRKTCPQLAEAESTTTATHHCKICGQIGHNKKTCPQLAEAESTTKATHHCKICGQIGHNKKTFPQLVEAESTTKATHHCKICGQIGHNRRTCPQLAEAELTTEPTHHCKICGQIGHNRRTCPQLLEADSTSASTEEHIFSKRKYTCSLCREKGHNIRTCPQRK